MAASPTLGRGQDVARLEARLKQSEERLCFLEGVQRKRSASMLLIGSVSGCLGFAFAFIIGIITERTSGHVDYNDEPFKSGRGYFPATVSEMVSNPMQPAGKCFFGFSFVGAILIFFSWYPTQLRNVYIGDDTVVCGVSWVSLRQYIPAPGMMMLSIITTVPAAKATVTDEFCVALHLSGAAMLFVGYFLCEAHCVGWGCFKHWRADSLLHERKRSVRQRKVCLTGILFFYTVFCLMQVVLMVEWPFFNPGEADQWGYVAPYKEKQLLNTAIWKVKSFKVISYVSEVLCGLLLILSHLAIWRSCEERQYDLPEHLDSLRLGAAAGFDSLGEGTDSEDTGDCDDTAEQPA